MKLKSNNLTIIYDGDCPICKNYIKYLELKKKFNVKLINARKEIQFTKKICNKYNLNINDGMIVIFNNKLYFAGEAIHLLENITLTKRKTSYSFLNFFLRIKIISKIMYPFFKFLRTTVLRVIGKKKIILK